MGAQREITDTMNCLLRIDEIHIARAAFRALWEKPRTVFTYALTMENKMGSKQIGVVGSKQIRSRLQISFPEICRRDPYPTRSVTNYSTSLATNRSVPNYFTNYFKKDCRS